MTLKRTTPEQMLTIVSDFWAARPGPLSGNDPGPHRFFVVPKYQALVRADPKAVASFFSFMALGKSSWLYRPLLTAACWSGLALKGAIKSGRIHGLVEAPAGVRWSAVDALLAEWQFVACFSLSEGLVAHCLSYEKYHRCLINEIEGRAAAGGSLNVPEMLAAYTSAPAGWTEQVVRADGKVLADDEPYQQVQVGLLGMYLATGREVAMADYLDALLQRADEAHEHEDVIAIIRVLVDRARSLCGEFEGSIWLARCHGDVNTRQILVEDGVPYVIDWSESEEASATHDFVYAAVFHHGWKDYDQPIDVPVLETLRRGLDERLRQYPPAFWVALTLAEVGVKQFVDFNERRGMLKRWAHISSRYLGNAIPS